MRLDRLPPEFYRVRFNVKTARNTSYFLIHRNTLFQLCLLLVQSSKIRPEKRTPRMSSTGQYKLLLYTFVFNLNLDIGGTL